VELLQEAVERYLKGCHLNETQVLRIYSPVHAVGPRGTPHPCLSRQSAAGRLGSPRRARSRTRNRLERGLARSYRSFYR
jgi:hypothetical protein